MISIVGREGRRREAFLKGQRSLSRHVRFFALFLVAQSITGFAVYNDDQREHGESTISYPEYLRTGHFVEAAFENWESEYLQIGAYVLFTVYLFQRGSSESKDPDKEDPVNEDPRQAQDHGDVPWPVRYGGPVLRLYEHSLAIAFVLLFLVSFLLHAIGGAREYSQEQLDTVVRPSRRWSSSVPVSSGFNRSRIGRASSWWFSRSWRCPSSCGNAAHRNQNPLPPRTARPGRREQAALHGACRAGAMSNDPSSTARAKSSIRCWWAMASPVSAKPPRWPARTTRPRPACPTRAAARRNLDRSRRGRESLRPWMISTGAARARRR